MSLRGAVGVFAAVVVALAVPSSVVAPNPSPAGSTGARSVSRTENAAAVRHWTTQSQQAATPTTTDQPPGPGVPAVGALFTVGANGLGAHYCTASVVDSPAGDLVITAAHCLHDGGGGDYRTDIAFVPGYHDGQDPYGIWTPSRLVVDPRWISDADEDVDVGFLLVHRQSSTEQVQSVTGGNQLGTDLGYHLAVRVTGYPDDTEQPTTCQTVSREAERHQLRFDCGDFPDGTSGGPWVTDVDPATGLGTVVGVIGGYQAGGDTVQVSYSSYFDQDVRRLYDTAVA
jgi:V8-like Glu-specific endopeptidase